MLYTIEQLLKIYHHSKEGWIMMRNDHKSNSSMDVSEIKPALGGAVESNGIWKIHISINPKQMGEALPILHKHFSDRNAPLMGMKIASEALLDNDHQSGKEVALVFDRVVEESKDGPQKILSFLNFLAHDFEKAGIKPESKPPLTVETAKLVETEGSKADKKNIKNMKYDAVIRFRKNEVLSYFNYRDEMALIFDAETYQMVFPTSPKEERVRMLEMSAFNNLAPQYKHNPLKRKDDFLYHVILERLFIAPKGSTVEKENKSTISPGNHRQTLSHVSQSSGGSPNSRRSTTRSYSKLGLGATLLYSLAAALLVTLLAVSPWLFVGLVIPLGVTIYCRYKDKQKTRLSLVAECGTSSASGIIGGGTAARVNELTPIQSNQVELQAPYSKTPLHQPANQIAHQDIVNFTSLPESVNKIV